MKGKLTRTQLRVLAALKEGALDVFEVATELGTDTGTAFDELAALREFDLIDWMYPEDQASITEAGFRALRSQAKE
jgi:hypothetical protein